MKNTASPGDIGVRHAAVMNWLGRNPEPVQELCPVLNQYWRNSKGQYVVWNSETGKRTTYDPVDYRNKTIYRIGLGEEEMRDKLRNNYPVRKYYDGFYLRYVKELNALEVASVYLKGGRGVDGTKKKWRYNDSHARRLIFLGDQRAYGYSIYEDGRFYSKETARWIANMENHVFDQKSYDEFVSWSTPVNGVLVDAWNRPMTTIRPWMLSKWYVTNNVQRQGSDLRNYLEDLELPDVDVPFVDKVHTLVYQKIDEQYAVIRVFTTGTYNYDWRTHTGSTARRAKFDEFLRVFIDSKGKVKTLVRRGGNWKMTSNIGYIYQSNVMGFANYEEALEWKPLKYILPVDKDASITKIIAMMRHPIVEQLAKAGYTNIAKEIMNNNEVAANLKKYFLANERKEPMYRMLGVNKHLLRTANEIDGDNALIFIREIKRMMGGGDISSLDSDTIDMLKSIYFLNDRRGLMRHLPRVNRYYWRDVSSVATQEERDQLMTIFRRQMKDNRILRTWDDTVSTYDAMYNRPDVNLMDWSNYSELLRLHDAMIALHRAEQADRERAWNIRRQADAAERQKRFEKLQEERIGKFEYENDRFAVRVPKELAEITQEGISLHHCVGGYVSEHAYGNTNILFLRRKSEESIPFYTIEIRGNKVIQIHGMNNRWLGNNPEAVPFMYEYLKQLGVDFDPRMLLNTSTGYCSTQTFLPNSALTASV